MSRSHGGKPFEAYKDDVLVGVFDLQNDAAKELGVPQADLQRVLVGKYSCARGYKFKYVGEDFRYVSKVPPRKERKPKCPIRLEVWRKRKLLGHTVAFNYKDEDFQIKRCRSLYKGILKVFKDGELVSEFLSLREASKSLNIKQGTITDIVAGRRQSAHGYTFVKEKLNA